MKKLFVIGLVAVAGAASAQNGFYNGDTDGVDAWSSQHGGSVADSRIYEDFHIGSTTTVNTMFGNFWDSTTGGETSAYWEIRQGVVGGTGGTGGSGGTLIASGTSAVTITDQNINYFGYEIQQYSVDLTSQNISLGAGDYWMTLAPDATGIGGQTFIGTTSGANQTGGFMNDGLAVWDSTDFGVSWQNGLNAFQDGSSGELSYGLTGTATPEPAAFAALGMGALALLRRRRRA